MKIGLGIGIPFIRNYISSLFDPSKLFTGSTNGVWYDPSDIKLTWRRNLLTYSEQFDNAAWTKAQTSVTANATTAPDGTITADLVTPIAILNLHGVAATVSVASGAYTISFAAKAQNASKIMVWSGAVAYGFDLANGTTSAVTGYSAPQSFSITSLGNGWYRCAITTSSAPTEASAFILQNFSEASYLGDGTSGIYIWGAQLELGSTATPYQRITDGIKDYLDYNPLPILYQDAAGTTPVTAVGQPVGLMLDKSKGLVLGPELVTNGDFSNGTTGWTLVNTTVSASQLVFSGTVGSTATQSGVFSSGKNYKFTIDVSRAGGTLYILAGGNVVLTKTTAGNVSFIANNVSAGNLQFLSNDFIGSVDNISVRELPGNHAFNSSGNSANFPVLSARYNQFTYSEAINNAAWVKSATATTPTANTLNLPATNDYIYQSSVIPAGQQFTLSAILSGSGTVSLVSYDNVSGFQFNTITLTSTPTSYSFTATVGAGSTDRRVGIGRLGTATATSVTVLGLDIRVANDALNQPAYQRVNTATDYDTVGFKPYLSFNGVNQWLQTNSIDFTYGDKMFVAAGVRKLSDATIGTLAELGASVSVNNGSFGVFAPSATAPRYAFGLRGTVTQFAEYNNAVVAAPITNVLSGIGNISGDQVILRVNGSQVASSTADQGTGNYSNYQLYIGARAGSSLWLNGRLYGLVVAGKSASASEITSCERYLNQKTGAY